MGGQGGGGRGRRGGDPTPKKGGGKKGGGPKGWGPERVEAPERVGGQNLEKVEAPRLEARRVGAEGWGPEGWGPENFALFFSLSRRKIFVLFFLLWCLLVEFWWCLKRRGPEMCTSGVLGLSCASPGGRSGTLFQLDGKQIGRKSRSARRGVAGGPLG